MSEISTSLGNGEYATGLPYEPPAIPPSPTQNNPETPCLAYQEMKPLWDMVDDLWGGTETMQAAGPKWLSKMPSEDDESYAYRLANSIFFNAFKRTVQFLVGKAFSRPVKLSEDMDADIKKMMEDVDREGRHVNVFLKNAAEAQVKDGHAILFVDYPDTGTEPITEGEKRRRGLRPYVVRLDPRNVLFWRSEIIDGRELLTHLRFREVVVEPVGEWGEAAFTYIKVFDRILGEDQKYHVIWRKFLKIEGDGKTPAQYQKVAEGNLDPQTEIPIVPAYGQFEGFFRSKPPLQDLMWLNIDHWRSSSDQRHILHVARVPFVFAKGFIPGQRPGSDAPAKVSIGPDRLISTSETDADMKFVEHSGKAIDSGFKDIDNIKMDMAVMGAEKLAKKMIFATATETMHDNTAEDSELSAMCKSLEDAWGQVMKYMAVYLGKDTESVGSIEINKDFGIFPWQIQYLSYLIQLNQQGKISDKTLLEQFQKFGAISDLVDVEAELEAAKTDFEANQPKLLPGVTQPKVPTNPTSPNPAGPAKPN